MWNHNDKSIRGNIDRTLSYYKLGNIKQSISPISLFLRKMRPVYTCPLISPGKLCELHKTIYVKWINKLKI